jgi:UDP-N-acetylmuramoyl-L-alanyl-D-glutamate--2,6-diaminopimelate ligase
MDHISPIEHSDFEDYFSAKLKIFAQCKNACVNLATAELPRVLEAAEQCEHTVTFGLSRDADVCGYDIRIRDAGGGDDPGILFRVKTADWDEAFSISMTGLFNVDNALAAIAAAYCLDIPPQYMKEGLAAARVSGRMEVFAGPDEKKIIVDYAHNKMSFEMLFASVSEEYPGCAISIVFGCPGGKALDRRRDLGTIAGRYASDIIITEEDAGEEALAKISAEIADYARAAGGSPRILHDREQAIRTAIDEAPAGSVILITGKGRETRQKRGRKYIPVTSDVDIVARFLS